MALPESCGLVWIFLVGGLIMALAISILSCLGAAATEGAKALLSTVFSLAASPAKAKPKPKPNSRGSKTGGGVERAAHAGGTTTAAAAAAASKRTSGKTKQASGRPSNKNMSGNGSAKVPPTKKARNGKGGGGGAASAAVAESGGGVHSVEPALNEKAVVSQLLDQFESLASMMGQKGGGGGGGRNNGQKGAALEGDNLTAEELWQLATEATRKRFEHLGREIQCSLFKLDQHLVGGGRRACREGRSGGGQGSTRDSDPVALTKKQLKDIEVDTRALHDLNRSLKDMLRWWGVSPDDEKGLLKLSPLLRKAKSNHAAAVAAAAAAATAATAPPDPTNSRKTSDFLSPSRANPLARGADASANSASSSNANAKADDALGAPRISGSGAHGARKPKRRPSPAGVVTNPQGPPKVSRRISSVSASASGSTPAATAVSAAAAAACDADASRASPMAPLAGTAANPDSPSVPGAGASVPGGYVVEVRPPVGTGAAAPAAAPGPSVGAESSPSRALSSSSTAPGVMPSRRTHQTKSRPIGEAAAPARRCGSASTGPRWEVQNGSMSTRGSNNVNPATAQPFPVAATYPDPLRPAVERRASAAPESFASVSTSGSEGFGCFPPPLLPRPAGRGGSCGGGVLQEARACAPAQHLAVLRALLDGDEEEQRAAVAWSDSDSDGERDGNVEGQTGGGGSGGPRQDGGGRGGRAKGKARGGSVAGRCVRA